MLRQFFKRGLVNKSSLRQTIHLPMQQLRYYSIKIEGVNHIETKPKLNFVTLQTKLDQIYQRHQGKSHIGI